MAVPRKPKNRQRLPMPEPIPDTPENIAMALLTASPKKASEWKYSKKHQRKR